MVDPVDYELVLRNPDRGEPDYSDFTSFEGEVESGQVLILPEGRVAGRAHRADT